MAHLAVVGSGGGDQVAKALQSVRPGEGPELAALNGMKRSGPIQL